MDAKVVLLPRLDAVYVTKAADQPDGFEERALKEILGKDIEGHRGVGDYGEPESKEDPESNGEPESKEE